jgi:hypothetical protein
MLELMYRPTILPPVDRSRQREHDQRDWENPDEILPLRKSRILSHSTPALLPSHSVIIDQRFGARHPRVCRTVARLGRWRRCRRRPESSPPRRRPPTMTTFRSLPHRADCTLYIHHDRLNLSPIEDFSKAEEQHSAVSRDLTPRLSLSSSEGNRGATPPVTYVSRRSQEH